MRLDFLSVNRELNENNMDEQQSKTIAERLIAANSAEDVRAVLDDNDARFYFDDPQNWSPYGNREKNWDTVGNQQTNPIGALVEIVTNGIDAILLRKAREAGRSGRGRSAGETPHRRRLPESADCVSPSKHQRSDRSDARGHSERAEVPPAEAAARGHKRSS